MAEEYIKNIIATGNQIDTDALNSNFNVIADRIKKINNELSFLNTLHVVDVFDASAENAVSSFINVWSTLSNYTGLVIANSDKFEVLGETCKSGDILVKMPDDQVIKVDGPSKGFFQPSYTPETGMITWTYNIGTDQPSPVQMQNVGIYANNALKIIQGHPTALVADDNNNHQITINGVTITLDDTTDAHFYDGSGEEIFFDWTEDLTAITEADVIKTTVVMYMEKK